MFVFEGTLNFELIVHSNCTLKQIQMKYFSITFLDNPRTMKEVAWLPSGWLPFQKDWMKAEV